MLHRGENCAAKVIDQSDKVVDERNRVNSAKDQTKIGDIVTLEKKERLMEALQKKLIPEQSISLKRII